MEVIRVGTVDSTMDEAKRRARAGAAHGTVVVAEEQTAGRGQHGRSWVSPPGGLYLSVVLRDVGEPRLAALAFGCAVADTLEVAGVDAQLKWVNDVWVQGRKIAGILVEGESSGAGLDFMVVGVGINVNDPPGGSLPPEATTLQRELLCESCIPDLEAHLVSILPEWVDRCSPTRRNEVLEAFRRRDGLLGKKVAIDGGPSGVADGIDDEGHLRVRTSAGVQTVVTGPVRLV